MPARAGLGLRSAHIQSILDTHPPLGWLEVHTENYFSKGGQTLYLLDKIREIYPLSLHGVGLSLGGVEPLDQAHLLKIKYLINRYTPALISEHLCWSHAQNQHFHDLLPLPYTEEALIQVGERIDKVQDILQTPIIIENIARYVEFSHSTLHEADFMRALVEKTGCGILLDVNNLYLNAVNHGLDPQVFLNTLPVDSVKEIHLAGFTEKQMNGQRLLLDTHNHVVDSAVWALFEQALTRFGQVPSLLEWDSDLPELSILLEEVQKIEGYLVIPVIHQATYA